MVAIGPFPAHIPEADPDAARTWLAAPADAGPATVGRAQQVATPWTRCWAWPCATGTSSVPATCAPPSPTHKRSAPAGARQWARRCASRRGERERSACQAARERILVVEGLLAGAVEDEHAGHRALRAVVERMAAAGAQVAAAQDAGQGPTAPADVDATEAVVTAAVIDEEELQELIAEQAAARLPGHEVTTLLRELARTAYPAGRAHRSGPRWPACSPATSRCSPRPPAGLQR